MRVSQVSIFVFITMLCSLSVWSQRGLNMEDHDYKRYYFGVNFGLNQSAFTVSQTPAFGSRDTFTNLQFRYSTGFHVGLMGTLKLTNFIDVRMLPTILFVNKPIEMTSVNSVQQRNIESIYMHVPLQLKFKSDRIQNFRFYGIAGGKVDYDMQSNSKSRRRDELIRVRGLDYGYELGFGFDFFFSNFIFTPEIKISQGLRNSHFHDPDLPLSNMVDQMRTRMFIFSIMLQS